MANNNKLNGGLALITAIVMVCGAVATAVVSVYTRPTRADVATMIEVRQDSVKKQVQQLCNRMDRVEEKLGKVGESQVRVEGKVDAILEKLIGNRHIR